MSVRPGLVKSEIDLYFYFFPSDSGEINDWESIFTFIHF